MPPPWEGQGKVNQAALFGFQETAGDPLTGDTNQGIHTIQRAKDSLGIH